MKRSSPIYLLLIFLIVGSLLSCKSSSRVILYLNDEANFKNYNTFKIINYKTEQKEYSKKGNALVDTVERYISEQMQTKGYEKNQKSDLLLRYELISGVETNVSYGAGYYGGLYNPYFYDPYNSGTRTTRTIEGILLIEIKERKNRKLVWQGSLDLKYSRRKKDNNLLMIQEAIAQIFQTYPYMAGQAKPIEQVQ